MQLYTPILLVAAMAAIGAPAAAQTPTPAPAQAAPSAGATHYTTADTDIGTLLDDPAAKAVLAKHVPDLVKSDQVQMARSMTLLSLQSYSPEAFSDENLKLIDADLAKLPVKK